MLKGKHHAEGVQGTWYLGHPCPPQRYDTSVWPTIHLPRHPTARPCQREEFCNKKLRIWYTNGAPHQNPRSIQTGWDHLFHWESECRAKHRVASLHPFAFGTKCSDTNRPEQGHRSPGLQSYRTCSSMYELYQSWYAIRIERNNVWLEWIECQSIGACLRKWLVDWNDDGGLPVRATS